MNLKVITIFLLGLFSAFSYASGDWKTHLPYSNPVTLTSDNNKIYAGCENSGIIVYDKVQDQVNTLSPQNGLNDTDIKKISYSSVYNLLVIGYGSSNIDLYSNGKVKNIPDLKNRQVYGDKTINDILISGKFAYLATGAGIIAVDLQNEEIKETYILEDNLGQLAINDIAIYNDTIWASTVRGLYKADLNENLMNFYIWKKVVSGIFDEDNEVHNIASFNDQLFLSANLNSNTDILAYNNKGNWSTFEETRYNETKGVEIVSSNNLVFIRDSFVDIYDKDLALKESFKTPINDFLIDEDGEQWMVRDYYGLCRADKVKQDNKHYGIVPNGPAGVFSSYMSSSGNYLYVAAGSHNLTSNGYNKGKGIYIYDGEKWSLPYSNDTSISIPPNIYSVEANPENEIHFFAGATGGGLFEFINGVAINNYHERNSVIGNIANFSSPGFCRVLGLDWDQYNNFWFTSVRANEMLYLIDKADTISPVVTKIPSSLTAPTDLTIDDNDNKWMITYETSASQKVLVVNDSYTELLEEDNLEYEFQVHNQDGDAFSKILCLEKSDDNHIWIGTDNGPVVYYNANEILNNKNNQGTQIKLSRDDGTGLADYLLATEFINDIKFDAADRIWFATATSGAYLYSKDGLTEIEHFTEENSPLLSNNVYAVGILEKTGEVFFGTDKGIVSYESDASIDYNNFDKALVYPNPVREDYNGEVTISGLMKNTTVKITDISGNIAFETKSKGGKAVWNIKNFNNNKVATGVYIIMLSSEDGEKSKILKLLVVN